MSDLFKTGVRPKIDEWLLAKSREVRDYGNYWSASSAGYCYRKVIFERLGVPKIESEDAGRKQRIFTVGHVFHQWCQEITRQAGISIAQELELQDEEMMVRGHFDDLVLIDGNLILYDIKTVNSRSFMWAKKNDNAMSYYHRMQLGTYMYMLRKNSQVFANAQSKNILPTHDGTLIPVDLENLTEARILKIEKENLMMMEQQLLWSPELESEVFNYWNELNAYWKNKKLPKCTCADHEGGFLTTEKYNGYYYGGEPCSLAWYEFCKKEGKLLV